MLKTDIQADKGVREIQDLIIRQFTDRISDGARVFCVGCDTDAGAAYLKDVKHCDVLAARVLKDRSEVLTGNYDAAADKSFESYSWKEDLQEKSFDAIIFADALEYIYDTAAALAETARFLKDHGSIFAMVPHIGYKPNLTDIMNKRRRASLSDHAYSSFRRMFTFAALERLYTNGGMKPVLLDGVSCPVSAGAGEASGLSADSPIASQLEAQAFGDISYLFCELKRSDYFDRLSLPTENGISDLTDAPDDLFRVFEDELSDDQMTLALTKKSVWEQAVHIRNIEAASGQKDAYIRAIEPAYREYLSLRDSKWVRLREKMPDRVALRTLSAMRHEEYAPVPVPASSEPLVSIIIPVYNQFSYTYDCVKSIVETVRDIPYEIIIGDDESKDETRKIKKILPGVRVNINHTDHGFVMNCNRAAGLAQGKYLVFLNNDTKVRENWLSSLLEILEKDAGAGMVGSKLIYDEENLQEAGGIIWQDATGWNYGRNQTKFGPEYNYLKEVDYVSGASFMIRKELWDQIGGFDQRFIPAYYEDTDLAFSVRKAGYRVMYQPRSEVFHFEGVSNGTDTGSGLKAYQEVNREKFAEKWRDELTKQYPDPSYLFPARERDQNRRIVLFIDHYIPTIDKDAGSKSTFSYIRIFLHMGYSVKFIGDNFMNPAPYTEILQNLGVEPLYGMWYQQNWQKWLKENGRFIDVVFANRPHITIKYIDALRQMTNAQIIYYGHDLHYVRTEREYRVTGDEEKLKEVLYWKSIEFEIMDKADTVFYPSYVEINRIKEEKPELDGRAFAIPVYMYEDPHEGPVLPAREKKDLLFVGGFRHAPNIDAAIWFVNEILPEVLKAHPDIVFHIVGSHPTEEVLNLASDHVIVHGFVSDETLIDMYHQARIVIAPLRFGAGMKGKIVEALYYQAPVITTSIGAEGMPEAEDVLVIRDDAAGTAEAISDLYCEYETLDQMAERTKAYIEKYFSENAAAAIVKSILR